MKYQKKSNKGHNRAPGLCPSDQLVFQAACANARRPRGLTPVGIKEPRQKKRKRNGHRW